MPFKQQFKYHRDQNGQRKIGNVSRKHGKFARIERWANALLYAIALTLTLNSHAAVAVACYSHKVYWHGTECAPLFGALSHSLTVCTSFVCSSIRAFCCRYYFFCRRNFFSVAFISLHFNFFSDCQLHIHTRTDVYVFCTHIRTHFQYLNWNRCKPQISVEKNVEKTKQSKKRHKKPQQQQQQQLQRNREKCMERARDTHWSHRSENGREEVIQLFLCFGCPTICLRCSAGLLYYNIRTCILRMFFQYTVYFLNVSQLNGR